MGRIPDHLVRLALNLLEGKWVTIGAKADPKKPGKKKGGTPVELDGDGKITKGPAALTGKRPSELSQSHLFTGQPHKSQRKLFAEPGDPPPPPRLDPEPEPQAQAQAPAKKEPKPKAKKPQNMSLLAVIRREGGISGGDFEHADFREHGLLGALNKNGFGIDDMAAMLVRGGHIVVPAGVSSPGDHLLQLLKKKTNSLLADKTSELEQDYEAYARAREEALANGHEERELEEVRGRGQEAGADAGTGDVLEEIFGPDLGRGGEAGAEEPGDLAGDAAEPAGGVDTSFDFGPAAPPAVEPEPAAPPALDQADNKRPKIGDKIKTRLGGSSEEQPEFEMDLMAATKPGHFAIGEGGVKRKEIPLESFDNFIDDMTGRVSVPADSGVAEIDAVASGKAKHLGRGDDGSAFQVGDKVVKTSTVSPFIPTNPGHRTPQEGLNRLHDQTMTHNKLAEILKDKGVGGVEPLEWHEHGGRGFAVSNLLDTKAKLNAEQIAKVRDTVDAIHDAGYVVGDDIQVGLNKNGDPVIYDLGKARKLSASDREAGYELEHDSSKFTKMAKQNGHEDALPLRSDLVRQIDRLKNSTSKMGEKLRAKFQDQLDQLDAKGAKPSQAPEQKTEDQLRDEYRKAKAARQAADNSDNPEDAFHADDALWNAEQALKKAGLDPAKDPQQSQGPAAPPKLNLFGQTEPTKPQPATTQGLFGEQVPVEDPKVQPQTSVADDAAKGLDWLDQKQDKKTDGTGEMFGGLFSPGRDNASQAEQEPVAPPQIKQPHEMTRAEFAAQGPTEKAKQYLADSGMHRRKVQAALDAGQPVPAEVLAEYPGIKKTEPQQGPTAKEITGKIQAETDARRAQAKQDDAKARVRDVEDYQQARQAAIAAGQDVNDGDEKQMRRMIRQNEKDKARALRTIANYGPDAEAQAFADAMDKENERLKSKLAKAAGPSTPQKIEPNPAATGPKSQSFDDFRRENGIQGYTIDHSMLSPSGKVSGRSANAARARVDKQFSDYNQAEKEYQAKVDTGEIVDPTGKYQKPDQNKANKAEAERMREKARNFRSIAARGMQTRKLTKQAEELEKQANELDPPAKSEAGPAAPPPIEPSEPVSSQGKMGAAKRRNLVSFNPIKGPSGSKLVGYNWEYDLEHYVDQRGEDRERKVSAWDRAEKAGMTNRDIVHMFTIEGPDGKQQNVSLETAAKMLGYDGGSEQFKAKFKSATSAAKTLARLQMEKAQVEQTAASRAKNLAELKQQAPAMDDTQTEEVPNYLGDKTGLRFKGTQLLVAFGGQGGKSKDEARKLLQDSWIKAELQKRGHNPYLGAPSVSDIDRRILRAKNKLDELTRQAAQPAPESRTLSTLRQHLREAFRA